MGTKRTNGQNSGDVRKNGSQPAAIAELLELLNERDDVFRHELRSTCRDLVEDVRRELQTQFTRIAQLQQEIDALKRRA